MNGGQTTSAESRFDCTVGCITYASINDPSAASSWGSRKRVRWRHLEGCLMATCLAYLFAMETCHTTGAEVLRPTHQSILFSWSACVYWSEQKALQHVDRIRLNVCMTKMKRKRTFLNIAASLWCFRCWYCCVISYSSVRLLGLWMQYV